MRHALRTIIAAALAGAALWLSGAGEAAATTILPNPGGEPSFDTPGGTLDTLYGLSNLTRIDDGWDQLWTNPGTAEVTALAKYADYSQVFGYLPGESGGSFVPLFSVTASGLLSGLSSSFTVADSGAIFRWADDPNGAGTAPGIWSSLPGDNGDSHLDHMVTFQITGTAGHPGNTLGAFVIAFEDLPGGGDRDYNDLVVEVLMIAPPSLTVTEVPAPGSLALLAAALTLGGGACWSRRRA